MTNVKGPKQPAPGASNLPGEIISVEPFCGHEIDGAQVTGDEVTNGHYESTNGSPRWVSGTNSTN